MRLLLLIPFFLFFNSTSQHYTYNSSTFEDTRDGRVYEIVEIGGLEWMAENLNYRVEGSMCYDNHPFNCRRLGRLYFWWEANRICPDGWRLPSDEDWAKLYKSYGGNA
ncbi:MAG: FISUMP domain-containing protein, partial [Saprospiraceae bacterium]